MSERFRKRLILKAYNRRKSNDSFFYDQFKTIAYKDRVDTKLYIDWSALIKYLDFTSNDIGKDLSDLSQAHAEQKRLDIDDLIYFLVYGSIRNINQILNIDNPHGQHNDTAAFGNCKKEEYELIHTIDKRKNEDETLVVTINQNLGTNIELHKIGDNNIIVDNNENKMALITYGSHEYVKPMGCRNIWRKSEFVKQERIVSYVTVDALGTCQELCETETTETEVLHMEYRDTGEFAHRETTTILHKETFNNEIVAENDGKEEYIHLKSIDNEVEFLESNLPKKPAETTEGYQEQETESQYNYSYNPENAVDAEILQSDSAYLPTQEESVIFNNSNAASDKDFGLDFSNIRDMNSNNNSNNNIKFHPDFTRSPRHGFGYSNNSSSNNVRHHHDDNGYSTKSHTADFMRSSRRSDEFHSGFMRSPRVDTNDESHKGFIRSPRGVYT